MECDFRVDIPIGEPIMERLVIKLRRDLKNLDAEITMIDHCRPQDIEDSDDIALRARYRSLLNLRAAALSIINALSIF